MIFISLSLLWSLSLYTHHIIIIIIITITITLLQLLSGSKASLPYLVTPVDFPVSHNYDLVCDIDIEIEESFKVFHSTVIGVD